MIVPRSRRSLDDVPPIASDDDLVAWAHELAATATSDMVAPSVPQSCSVVAAPHPRRRREPLRAARSPRGANAVRVSATAVGAAVAASNTVTIDELFEDIATRAAAVHHGSRLRGIAFA